MSVDPDIVMETVPALRSALNLPDTPADGSVKVWPVVDPVNLVKLVVSVSEVVFTDEVKLIPPSAPCGPRGACETVTLFTICCTVTFNLSSLVSRIVYPR